MLNSITMILVAIITSCIPLILKKDFREAAKERKKDRLDIMRLIVMNLIQHDPKNKYAIHKEYDEYKLMGGNTYLDSLYEEWKKRYDK